ncbi:MAG: prepilin-type N-terminal cleavage/methylation domain-containing protein [Candidatus Sericytochromatia bacterium]|nr:prepilin-type N-terminal cleavage/methylation domain-containing protein [Candidatus Tanganyikabacteria bacterium]
MRRVEKGFSLLENVFAAMMVAIVILGMSTVISTYTINQQKTKDRPFAINLAQQQMDEVLVNIVTQNAMVFDTAPQARGRSYYLKSENMTVSQYYFNNFPLDAPVDPVAEKREMKALPWTTDVALMDSNPIPSGFKDSVYSGAGAYIRQTLFYRNRFYRAGGELIGTEPSAYPTWTEIKEELKSGTNNPPKYAVRLQLFGIPSILGSSPSTEIVENVRDSIKQKSTEYDDDPLKPPAALKYLIGDSCIPAANDTGGPRKHAADSTMTGRVYVRERSSAGADSPYYYPHFTSKVLVARVYRIDDYANDGTFLVDNQKPDQEIASASLVVVGRVQRK